VARALRRDAGLRDVRIIAISGYGQEADRQRSREAGIDQHLVKPADPAFLESLLGGSR
jgi:two-component system CheB/CheR fusion protein